LLLFSDGIPITEESVRLEKELATAPNGAGVLLLGPAESRHIAMEQVTKNRWFTVKVDLTPHGADSVADTIQDLSDQIGFVPSFNQLSGAFDYLTSMVGAKPASNVANASDEQLKSVLKVLTLALKIVSRTYPADGRPFSYAVVSLDFKSCLSEAGNPAIVPLLQQWALEIMRLKLAHVVVSADSHHVVTNDSSLGALRNHSYILHPIQDLERETVKELLEPLFEGIEEKEPVNVEEMNAYLLQEQASDLFSVEEVDETPQADAPGYFRSLVRSLPLVGTSETSLPPPEEASSEAVEPVVAPPPPPPPPPAVEEEGFWGKLQGLLELSILRKSRDIYARYAGAEQNHVDIPMEGFTLNTLSQLVYVIMGGRLPDVAKFVQRVQSTRKSPLDVLQLMQDEAQAEILNRAFGKKLYSVATPGAWTQVQVWKCIKAIAAAENQDFGIPMEQTVLKIFKGDRKALQELIRTGIFCTVEKSSDDILVAAGSPLYLHVFKLMTHNPSYKKGLEVLTLDEEYKKWSAEALQLEEDLNNVGRRSTTNDMSMEGLAGLRHRKSQLASRLGELSILIEKNRSVKNKL
jgi:hypothetical protein